LRKNNWCKVSYDVTEDRVDIDYGNWLI
jgi:hypothetical protein